ncbi:MAG: hypothetical protein AAF799_45440 [Myxococcota bacterium]
MKSLTNRFFISAGFAAALAIGGCADDGASAESEAESDGHDDHGHDDHGHDDHGHEHDETEVITTVTLTFTPQGEGTPVTAAFTDPDGDGGASGSADPITLAAGTTYDLTLSFTNELVDPVEDVTAEIQEEAEEHQVFISGDTVTGPASTSSDAPLVTHAYADTESTYGHDDTGEDLPVGLANTIEATTAGMGTFSVRLQHMPPLNDEPIKTPGLEDVFAMDGALPGDVDVDIDFQLTVQ